MFKLPFSLTYVGHATLLIEVDGVRILTDPVLGRHVGQTPLPERRIHQVDLVLLSHLHFDHLDLRSLRLLGLQTRLIAPVGAARFLHRHGFASVTEMRPGETMSTQGLQIEATVAIHKGVRSPFGPDAGCLGYVVRGRQAVYFAGDTDLFPGMADLGRDLDLALLPVWGWGPTLGKGHMDPRRAAEALTLLKPRAAVPIHWGTLYPLGMRYFRPHLLTAPPRLFAQHARTLAPEVQVHIVEPGQVLTSFQ
jgi:L-ascorbate metabolism protein UlaG (beta-lactamase superfamily)